MKNLKSEIEDELVAFLREKNIKIALNDEGKIRVEEIQIDEEAQAGMLYLRPISAIPNNQLPCLIGPAVGVYAVMHHDGEAVMIEISTYALEGVPYPRGLVPS